MEKFIFCFQRRILGIFFALATPHGFKSNSKENKKPCFYHIPWFKDCGGFKADETCNDIRWYRSRFLQTLISCNLSAKVYSLEIHAKMAIFWLVFLSEKPSEIR